MEIIKDREFGGERPLFGVHDVRLERITVRAGESAVKECRNVEAVDSHFEGNYPFWHVDGLRIAHCHFDPAARSALWYSHHVVMEDSVVDAPKMFREMTDVTLRRVQLSDADEVLWRCHGVRAEQLTLRGGTYPFMLSTDLEIDGLEADSKYVFQYVRDAVVRNARITTKDGFWEAENVTVYDSVLDGEYLGWHSRGLRLVRCHIRGEQPLCYARDLVLEDCTFDASCDRAFEYSTLRANISGAIANVKNPTSGRIVADAIGSVTLDEHVRQPADCVIEQRRG